MITYLYGNEADHKVMFAKQTTRHICRYSRVYVQGLNIYEATPHITPFTIFRMRVQNETTKYKCAMPDKNYKTKLDEEIEEIWMVDELITQFIVISAISSSSST